MAFKPISILHGKMFVHGDKQGHCSSVLAKDSSKRDFLKPLASPRSLPVEKQQQFAQINSNLNPISGSRPISIGRIITECEASSGAPTVQIVLLQIYTSSRLMQECTACVAPFNTSHSCNCANVQRTQSVATVQRPPANSSSSC